jgi:hypothetical protein
MAEVITNIVVAIVAGVGVEGVQNLLCHIAVTGHASA